MTTLIAKLIELREIRAGARAAASMLKARREEFDLAHKDLILFAHETAAAVDMAETAVKAIALSLHASVGTKKPAPGVEIKMFKEYAIDEDAGLKWATEKQLCLIPAKLDIPAIKKLATVQPLPFVLIDEVPRATIATDLSKLDFGETAAAPDPADAPITMGVPA
jgi:hypothetical protein